MDPDIAEWLQKVLSTIGYQQRDRMFADVEAVLRLYQNFLVPNAETYTHDNGRSQLLLSLIGTIPIVYQSATYNIPVAFWLPTSYPSVAPIVFVTPTALMMVKAGKYVDTNGRCYHPYLAYWSTRSDSNLVELISILQGVFSQEPPVYAKSVAITSQAQSSHSPTPGNYPSQSPSLRPAPAVNYSPRMYNNSAMSTTPPTGVASPSMASQSYNSSYHQQQSRFQSSTASSSNLAGGSSSGGAGGSSSMGGRNGSIGGPVGGSGLGSSGSGIVGGTVPPHLNAQQAQLYTKLHNALYEFNSMNAREMNQIVNVNKQLNDAETRTKTEIQNLKDLEAKIQHNISTLRRVIDQLTAKIEQIQSWPEEPIDEIICGSSLVHNQLFELVAEENAIEDTIYALDKALIQDKIELSAYMKHVRNLSREQFMKRALIKKVKNQLGLEA
ncbi:hypothetical protein BGZ73_006004 [Actinomortierella ambigua]|nr:hypothetical protein BGZ73_006004 [Actinomortierella ambigua]